MRRIATNAPSTTPMKNPPDTESPNRASLSPREISRRWNTHPETARRMMRDGRLPAFKLGGRLRSPEEAVRAYETAHAVVAKQPHY